MKTSIHLEALEIQLRIGICDFERHGPQRYLVDIHLDMETDLVFRDSDDFSGVFDYRYLHDEVLGLAARGHFDTQEFFASEILRLCALRDGVIGFTVHVRKPDVYPDCRSIGLTIAADAQDLERLRAKLEHRAAPAAFRVPHAGHVPQGELQ